MRLAEFEPARAVQAAVRANALTGVRIEAREPRICGAPRAAERGCRGARHASRALRSVNCVCALQKNRVDYRADYRFRADIPVSARYSCISPIFSADILRAPIYPRNITSIFATPYYRRNIRLDSSAAKAVLNPLIASCTTPTAVQITMRTHTCAARTWRGAAARRGMAWRGVARRGAARRGGARARRDLRRAEALRALISRASRTAEVVATRAPHIAHEVAPSTCRCVTCGRLRRRRRARFRAVVRARVPSFATACGAPR